MMVVTRRWLALFRILVVAGLLLLGALLVLEADGNAPPSAEATTGWTPRPKIWGTADVHNHQFANYGFGGLINFGNAYDTCDLNPANDLERALPWSDFTPVRPHNCSRILSNADIINTFPLSTAPLPEYTGHTWCPSLFLTNCGPNCPADTSIFNVCDGSWVHGPGGTSDYFNMVACTGANFGHGVGGYPLFDGYPRWNSCTGQKVYHDWLKRAFNGGQKLMVMHAANSDVICNNWWRIASYACDDASAISRQIQGAKDLETYIDRIDDGNINGSGWYKVVYTPQEARTAIANGKMAVVLGVEVGNLFGCQTATSCGQLASAQGQTVQAYVESKLQQLHDMGARHLFPIHGLNNAFGGTATWNDVYFIATYAATGAYPQLTNACPADLRFRYEFSPTNDLANILGAPWPPPAPPAGANCNAQGLTDLGKFLIDEMIDRKMLIEVDHMSAKSFDDTLTKAEARGYTGVVSGHTAMVSLGDQDIDNNGTNEYSSQSLRHEAHRTNAQMARIRNIGGFQGLILQQGEVRQLDEFTTAGGAVRVPLHCGHSSNAWVQQYLYAIEQYKGANTGKIPGIGLATDTAGATMTVPRFGSDACAGDTSSIGPGGPSMTYPFTLFCSTLPGACGPGQPATMIHQVVGAKLFQHSNDGLANVGLLPDFIADLQAMGLQQQDLLPLFSGAEAYICMWENAYNGVTKGDVDSDGLIGFCDNCPSASNSNQLDVNNNGLGDRCEDTDLDGCTDGAELQTPVQSQLTGGLRNYTNFWDFFDTPNASNVRDKAVAGTDFFRLLSRFGTHDSNGQAAINRNSDPLSVPPAAPAYHPAFDRGSSAGPNTWNLTAANGAIAGTDFFSILGQFGHNCA